MMEEKQVQSGVIRGRTPTSADNSFRGKPITYTDEGLVLSYHYDDVWDFTAQEDRGVHSRTGVAFTQTDPEHKKEIQDTLFDLYKLFEKRDKIAPTSNQLTAWKRGLQHLSRLLGHTNWSVFDDRMELKRFKRALKKRQLSLGNVSNMGTTLSMLFDGMVLHNRIDSKALRALSSNKPKKQHIAIPICMYQQILTRALASVEKYHPYRHQISTMMEKAYDIQERILNGEDITGNYAPLSLSNRKAGLRLRVSRACKSIEHSIPDYKVDLNGVANLEIQTACMIVILAFSGARIGETSSFNKNSYTTKSNNGKDIAVLIGETTKGNDGKPKQEVWQSHPVSQSALELAEDMHHSLCQRYKSKIQRKSESGEYHAAKKRFALKQVQSAFIPPCFGFQKDTYVATHMSRNITKQTKQWGIKATSADVEEFNLLNPAWEGTLKIGGFLPKLTPHDFRRTFAVFFKRYNFGSAAGIKFQFKQHNINMADYYANNATLMHMNDVLLDKDLLKEIHEAGIALGVDIYDEIYNKSENLSDLGGEDIVKNKLEDQLKKLKSGNDIYMSREDIEKGVRSGELAIVQLPTGGYCTNTSCERVCGISQFIAEKSKCIHQVYTDKAAKLLARQRKRTIDQFKGMNLGDRLKNSILAGLKQKILDAEITLKKHKIEFEPFIDEIVGVMT
ncbi:hypothetical protein PE36_22630 [Moritella sp. PE36]|uniref:hypothetical protein n=1 Tax=Moritella sp. PE36 TaxID=58051 RepID=UPI0001568E02|nr:hypothetical protein [Moritella sp. PE36]EDM64707.1 hypothetical protein PE36_22630 [Moritella sp. PE36]